MDVFFFTDGQGDSREWGNDDDDDDDDDEDEDACSDSKAGRLTQLTIRLFCHHCFCLECSYIIHDIITKRPVRTSFMTKESFPFSTKQLSCICPDTAVG